MLFIKIFPANEPALRPELGCKPNKNITDLDAKIGNSYRMIRYAPYFCSLTGRWWEIPFSPPKMTIRFSPIFGLRFKKINFSGDFG